MSDGKITFLHQKENTLASQYGEFIIDFPKPIWKIWILGSPTKSLHGSVVWQTSQHKNWFHRKMTQIFFGWTWEKL